jgi:putative glutamine amidotransferase
VATRPVIGIAAQSQQPPPGEQTPSWAVEQTYVRALTDAGAIPWMIPALQGDEETLRLIYQRIEGVFLKGGVDVNPALYNEDRHSRCGTVDPARDWVEVRLAEWAVRDRKPLLGVCRGVQLMNVALGGTLYQHLPEQFGSSIVHDASEDGENSPRRDSAAHEVRTLPATRLRRILGDELVPVNSMHHQAIKELAATLVATAFAPDGLIEGVEGRQGGFVVGVQWHPEELSAGRADMQRLFGEFVQAAAEFQDQSARGA